MKGHGARVITAGLVVGFVSCIVIANWAMLNLGRPNGAEHPHTIPVGFGLDAPSGVIFAGAMLTLRDAIHERLGSRRTLALIVLAAPLTALVASPGLAMASTVAFLATETADLAAYSRLRRRSRLLAVVGSNVLSTAIDSVVFLTLAFGAAAASAQGAAMVVGKFEASMAVLALLAFAGMAARRTAPFAERSPVQCAK